MREYEKLNPCIQRTESATKFQLPLILKPVQKIDAKDLYSSAQLVQCPMFYVLDTQQGMTE